MPTRFATLPNLRKELGHNRLEITLQETITLLGKVRWNYYSSIQRHRPRRPGRESHWLIISAWRFIASSLRQQHHRKDSKEHVQSTFSDWDKTNKGYVEAIDVVAVANEQEGHHLTEQQASRLIQYFAMGDNRMTMDNFQRILHPKKWWSLGYFIRRHVIYIHMFGERITIRSCFIFYAIQQIGDFFVPSFHLHLDSTIS